MGAGEEEEMTNRERYAKEMLGMLGYGVAVDRKTGRPTICEHIKCLDCLFDSEQDCSKLFRKWLDAEYVELIKTIKASELPIDTKVICWNCENYKYKRYFAKIIEGKLYTYADGATSWSNNEEPHRWEHMELEDGTIVLAE